MENSTTMEKGFLPILVVIIIVIVSVAGGTTLYYIKEKPEKNPVQNTIQSQPPSTYSPSVTPLVTNTPSQPTNYVPSLGLSPTPVRIFTSSPVPSISPKVQIKTSDSSENLNLTRQFATIEQEVLEGKAKGSLFSPSHSDRILNDLNNLESKGYLKSEIDRLRQIVIELSPHLKDQAIPSASPMASSTLSPTPSITPSCLKTNPALIADITDFTKIKKITAPGSSSPEGPKGHSFVWTNGERVPVYAPIAGVLESGAYSKDNESSPAQYLLMFKVKGYCDFQFKFDHIDEPVDVIRSALPPVPKVADSRGTFVTETIEFKAGDLIGYTKGNIPSGNWDFGLYNMAQKGALVESYGLHAYSVCWVDFYSSVKQQPYRALLEGPRLVCSF